LKTPNHTKNIALLTPNHIPNIVPPTLDFNIACKYPYLIFFPDRIRRVQAVVVSGLQEELREEEELLLSPQEGTLPRKARTQKAAQGDDGYPH
jgi:hypothetical protein